MMILTFKMSPINLRMLGQVSVIALLGEDILHYEIIVPSSSFERPRNEFV